MQIYPFLPAWVVHNLERPAEEKKSSILENRLESVNTVLLKIIKPNQIEPIELGKDLAVCVCVCARVCAHVCVCVGTKANVIETF